MSRQEDIEKLINTHTRHLRELKKQKASFGSLHVPTHILTQIEDREREIKDLQTKLKEIEDRGVYTPQTNTTTSSNVQEKSSRGFLIIKSGRYWAEGHWDDAWTDATPILLSMVSNGELELAENYDRLFGDPMRKIRKKLTITYLYGGLEVCITVPQDTKMKLPLPLSKL